MRTPVHLARAGIRARVWEKHQQDENIINPVVAFSSFQRISLVNLTPLHEGKIYIDYLYHYNRLTEL